MKHWNDYFHSLDNFYFADWFSDLPEVWGALNKIKPGLKTFFENDIKRGQSIPDYVMVDGPVWVGEGTTFEPGVYIKGPVWIGSNCKIRHGAYLREYSVIGDNSVVGNSTEIKHSILLGQCEVPHFNYVGDSILGWKAHLGAGSIISNFKQTSGTVSVVIDGQKIDTGLRKFGAIMGDHSTVGCNGVLNPGSLIGQGSVLYAQCNWRGVLPSRQIVKIRQSQEIVEMR